MGVFLKQELRKKEIDSSSNWRLQFLNITKGLCHYQ